MKRPLGVTILALLSLISGIVSIAWGLALAGFGGLSWLTGLVIFAETVRAWGGAAFWGGMLGLVVGIVQLIVAGGLFGLKRWAWLWAVISAGISLIIPLVELVGGNWWSLRGLIIPAIILFYLFSTPVRRAFGQA